MGDPHLEENTKDRAYSFGANDDEGRSQENSHVFSCMQCDLQFQVDAVPVSHEEAQEEEELLVRLRLPEGMSQTQRAIAEQMYERVAGGRKLMIPLTQPLQDEYKELPRTLSGFPWRPI